MKEIVIDGVKYAPVQAIAESMVMVRTYSAGVHFGEMVKREGREVVLKNARRVWSWAGAASLSELAVRGTKKPNECKIPCAVPAIILTEAIEIISMTDCAVKSLLEVPEWTA